MRCDNPVGYDEELCPLEPSVPLFFQLLDNSDADITDDESSQHEVSAVVHAVFGDDESDDNFSFPSLHTISDASLTSGDESSDEGEVEPVDYACEVSHNQESFTEVTFKELSENDEESCNPENDSAEVYQVIDGGTDFSENDNSDGSPPIVFQVFDNCEDISDSSLQDPVYCEDFPSSYSPHSNEISLLGESSVQADTSPNNNIAPPPNTYASLFVVVPPTSLNESDNLLSEVSSDRLYSDIVPVNPPSSSLLISHNENILSTYESLRIINKICDNSEELAPDSPSVSSSFSVTGIGKDYTLSELDSSLNIENSVSSDTKLENTISFDEHLHAGFDADLSGEMNIQREGNASCDVTSDKSVSNLKRKVASSVDDSVISKVPKYSLSHESNESINDVSLDNYSKDTEMPIPCDEDNTVVPTTVNVENVEEDLAAEQQKDS